MQDTAALFPESEYVRVNSVPVFKQHSRVKSGKLVTVDKDDLDQIAENVNKEFDELGIAVPLTLGHTREGKDGEDLDETQQPEIVGWSAHYKTGKLANGEDALFCDWYVRKEHSDVIRRYPTRSVEYYINRKSIWPIALLKSSAPELSLPIIKYKYGKELQPNEEPPIQFTINEPLTYSNSPPTKETDSMAFPEEKTEKKEPMDKPEDKAVKDAEQKETKGAKESDSKLADLEQKVNSLMAFLPVMEQIAALLTDEGNGDDDLMKPTDKPMPSPDEGKGTDSKEKEVDKREENPVKFDGAMGSSTNTSIPSFSKDKKEEYQVSNDELVKYKKAIEDEVAAKYKVVEAELAATKKVADDLLKKSRLAEAKEMVRSLEEDFHIQYKSEKERNEDINLLTKLDPAAAKEFVEMAKNRYQKRLPDSESVKNVAKYAVEGEPEIGAKTPEEAWERAQKILNSGLTREQWYAKQAESKTKQ